jgi:hypothetical protein
VTKEADDVPSTHQPTTGDMIGEIATQLALAGVLVAAILAPPFLLFRSLTRTHRSHPTDAIRQPGDPRL